MVSISVMRSRYCISFNTDTRKKGNFTGFAIQQKIVIFLGLHVMVAEKCNVHKYKEGKFVFHFSNYLDKTYSYGLEISRNIEIKYFFFQFKAYFHYLNQFSKY